MNKIIAYDVSSLPTQNYHLSLAKMIMDQWEIATAEIEYDVNILHVMETTKFLSASQLSWDANQWPVWANSDYVWKRVAFSSEREHGHDSYKSGHFSPVVTSAYSMNRLMLFSENRQVSAFNVLQYIHLEPYFHQIIAKFFTEFS